MRQSGGLDEALHRAAVAVLTALRAESETVLWATYPKWTHTSADTFELQEAPLHPRLYRDRAHARRVAQLPEYETALDALRHDPDVGPLLDKATYASHDHAVVFQAPNLIDGVLYDIVRATGSLAADDATIRRVVGEMLSELRAKTAETQLLVPLLSFSGEVDPIALDGLELRRMTDDEISECLALGGVPVSAFTSPDRRTTPAFAFTAKHSVTTWTLPLRATDPEQARASIEATNDFMRAVVVALECLLLLGSGPVRLGGMIRSGVGRLWAVHVGADPFRAQETSRTETYQLQSGQVAGLQRLFSIMRDTAPMTAYPFLPVALRRFRLAAQRDLTEDRAIDLMIAAEAVLLADLENRYRGELRYRLLLRAARLAEAARRREVQRHMKIAYDVRSALVHGEIPSRRLLKTDLGTFTTTTEAYVRDCLHTCVLAARARGGERPLVDWEAMILG